MLDDVEASREDYEIALGIFRELGDGPAAAELLHRLALAALSLGDKERARALVERLGP